MRNARSFLAFWLVCGLLWPAAAAADPRPMSAGAEPVPTRKTRVALVREDLTIDVSRTHARVRAVLFLENRGKAISLNVGFPCDASRDPGIAGLVCTTPIAVTADDVKIATRLVRRHFVWPMRFAVGQRVKLEVSYDAPLINDRYEVPYSGMGLLHYQLVTGAEWAGPIGELNIELRLPSDALLYIWPEGYTRSTGTVIWRLVDHEPESDVAVLVHPMYLGRYSGALRASTRDDLVRMIESGEFSGAKLAEVVREMRFYMDDILSYGEFFVGVGTKKLALRKPTREEIKACLLESLTMMEETAGRSRPAPP